MSTPSATQQPAPRSALRRLLSHHPEVAFLVMAYTAYYAVAYATVLLPVLIRRDILPFNLAFFESLGNLFGSALPAFLVVAAMHGQAGVRDLARRCLRWRVRPQWYLAALLVPIAVLLLLHESTIFGLAPLNALVDNWTLLFTVMLPQLLLLIVFFNLTEEIGWTGFLQARLQDRYGPLKASVIVTVPFALWHLPDVMFENGIPLARLPSALGLVGALGISQLFGRVVLMWLYNNTHRSVLLVGLFHSAFDATVNKATLDRFAGESILGLAEVGFLLASSVVAVAAVLIVIFTRGRLSYRPNQVSQRADAPLTKGYCQMLWIDPQAAILTSTLATSDPPSSIG